MRALVAPPLAAFLVLAGSAGCGQQKFTSHLTHYCSIDPDEDPHYTCAKGSDLVCVSTYSISVEKEPGVSTSRPIYVCRLACSPEQGCPESGDVCCPGTIHGRTYGKSHACVPREFCQGMDAGVRRDSAPRPPASDAGAGADGAGGGVDAAGADRTSTTAADTRAAVADGAGRTDDAPAPAPAADARAAAADAPAPAPAPDAGADAPMTFDAAGADAPGADAGGGG